MTSVSITTATNTVSVVEGDATVVTVATAGPQGPSGSSNINVLNDLADVVTTSKVDKSVLYYDASTSLFKADAVWTTSELTDGGNF